MPQLRPLVFDLADRHEILDVSQGEIQGCLIAEAGPQTVPQKPRGVQAVSPVASRFFESSTCREGDTPLVIVRCTAMRISKKSEISHTS